MQAASFLLLALVCLQASDAATVQGRCPSVTAQSELDAAKYVGVWYEYKRLPSFQEAGQVCTYANYTLDGAKIHVNNVGYHRLDVLGGLSLERENTIEGFATVPDASKPAELLVDFGGFMPMGDSPNYKVVDTDYENYSLVFSCMEFPFELFNLQFAWILTRERGVAPATLDILEGKLSAAGVDVKNLFTVDQTGCEE